MTDFYDDYWSRAKITSGFIIEPQYYNDIGQTSAFKNFSEVASSSLQYQGPSKYISLDMVNENGYIPKETLGIKNDLYFSKNVVIEIEKVAQKIVDLGKIRFEDARDFLYILITIDSIEVMKKIAEICDIPELANEDVLNKAMEILSIPHIEKVAFLADAIAAIIKAYNKFFGLSQHEQKTASALTAFGANDILEMMTGALGLLFGGGGISSGGGPTNTSSSTTMLGLNLSRLLKGKEIPMGVQTNNPTLVPPSVVGERMFGQAPGFTFLNDFNQPIQKKIAIFDRMQGASGTQALMMKIVKSISSSQSLEDAIANFVGGNKSPFSILMGERAKVHLPNVLGGKLDEKIELKYADSGIPFMKAMADVFASSMSEKRPEMDKEMREQLEYITGQANGIENLFKRGINKEEASKNGLNKISLTSDPLPIIIDIVSLFPTKIFQEGWQEMTFAHQEMAKDDQFYKAVLLILENLSRDNI